MPPSRSVVSPRSAGALALAAGWIVSLFLGAVAFGAVTGLLLALGYVELRRDLGAGRSALSLALGLAGVAAFAWIGASRGPEDLPWVAASVLVTLFLGRIVVVELGIDKVKGTTTDVAATLAATCVTGLLGAHVLLVRSTSRFGFGGAVAFGAILVARAVVSTAAGGVGADTRRWRSLAGGAVGALAAGGLAGVLLDPPLSPVSGLGFGATIAVLAPIGDAALRVLRPGAAPAGGPTPPAATPQRSAGVLPLLGGPLVCAPVFYWAFRTLVL